MTVYEGMFLLDNDLVRAGWPKAKSTVSGLLEKHGGKVLASRRWEERRLAYRIKKKNRATFLLTHYEIPSSSIPAFQRDLEINESVLRYLLLKVDEVPAQEIELTQAEDASDFVVPEPPEDSFDEVAAQAETEESPAPASAPAKEESKEAKPAGESAEKPAEEKAAEKPAEEKAAEKPAEEKAAEKPEEKVAEKPAEAADETAKPAAPALATTESEETKES